jgi:hypothetical protein
MIRRVSGSILLALVLAGSQHVTTTAAAPLYLVCRFANATDLLIVIENFGGVDGAVHQCVFFWQGLPQGVVS